MELFFRILTIGIIVSIAVLMFIKERGRKVKSSKGGGGSGGNNNPKETDEKPTNVKITDETQN